MMSEHIDYYQYGIKPLPDEIKLDNFGEVLKTIRLSEVFTSTDLATVAKVSQSYISQLENNVRLPSDKIIYQLSSAIAKGLYKVKSFQGEPDKLSSAYVDDIDIEIRKEYYNNLLKKSKNERNNKLNSDLVHQAVVNSDKKELLILSEEEKKIIERLRSLSSSNKKELIKYLNYLVHSS